MSLKHFYVLTCDGPCGTALDRTTAKIPEDWKRLQLGALAQKSGQPNPCIFSIVLCPKCQEKITNIMRHQGYVITLSPGQKAQIESEVSA